MVCALIMFGADGTLSRELPTRRKNSSPRLMLRLYGPYPQASLEVWPAKENERKGWRRDYKYHLASENFPPTPNPSWFARVSEVYENPFVTLGELFAGGEERRQPAKPVGSHRSNPSLDRKTPDRSTRTGQRRSMRMGNTGLRSPHDILREKLGRQVRLDSDKDENGKPVRNPKAPDRSDPKGQARAKRTVDLHPRRSLKVPPETPRRQVRLADDKDEK